MRKKMEDGPASGFFGASRFFAVVCPAACSTVEGRGFFFFWLLAAPFWYRGVERTLDFRGRNTKN
jgi:hypothetical protein